MIKKHLMLVVTALIPMGFVGCNRTVNHTRYSFEEAAIPIEYSGGVPIVLAKINDRGPYRFLLDTGSVQCCIFENLRKELELDTNHVNARVINAFGNVISYKRAAVVKKLTLPNEYNIYDVNWLVDSAADNKEYDGILGYELFSSYYVTLDFKNRLVSLNKNHPKLMQTENRVIFPLKSIGGVPAILGKMKAIDEKHQYPLIIDTGSGVPLLLPESLRKEIDFELIETREIVPRGSTKSRPVDLYRFKPDLILGDRSSGTITIKDTAGCFMFMGNTGFGSIGIPVLKSFVVIIDPVKKQVEFLK